MVLLLTIFQSVLALAGGGGGGPVVTKDFKYCEVAKNPQLIVYLGYAHEYYSEYDSTPGHSNPLITIESRDGKKLLMLAGGPDVGDYSKVNENKMTSWINVSYTSPLVKIGDKNVYITTDIFKKQSGTFKAVAKESGVVIINSNVRCMPTNRKW